MFAKFLDSDVTGQTQAKTSVVRSIKQSITDAFPSLGSQVDIMFPKKAPVFLRKCTNYVSLIECNDVVWFFQERDGPIVPTLRTLHKYPDILPKVRVDRGAIPHVLRGSDIFSKGLTSKGGDCSIDVPAKTVVAVFAEGKKLPLAIGLTRLSTQEIRSLNKDVGVNLMHVLNDGLWRYTAKEAAGAATNSDGSDDD